MSQQVFPELPLRGRRARDSGALLFMLLFLSFLGYILWDGLYMKETDVNLIVHGHDSYGNICGRNNKPIRFAKNSGQNYLAKPFTKYTLINSQFERYTLDSSRLKNGELIYVKESDGGGLGDDDENDDSGRGRGRLKGHERDTRAAALATSGTLLTVVTAPSRDAPAGAKQQTQRQQSQTQTQMQPQWERPGLSLQALRQRENQTKAPRASAVGVEVITRARLANASGAQTNRVQFDGGAAAAAAARADDEGNGSRAARPPRGAAGPSGDSSQGAAFAVAQARSSRRRRSPVTEGPSVPLHFDPVELARTNRSLLNALRTSLMYQYPPMHGYSSQLQHRANQRAAGQEAAGASRPPPINGSTSYAGFSAHEAHLEPPANAPRSLLRVSSGSAARATPEPVAGSGDGDRDRDRFEHTLVAPVTSGGGGGGGGARQPTSGVPMRPFDGGISQSEAPSQLLYLTECVASCPGDYVELVFYRCLPNNWRFSLFPNAINVTRTFIDDILTDVSHCYRELIYTFSLALVLSLGLLILLRFLASLIIWSCLLLLISLFLSMAGYSWFTFYNHIMDLERVAPHDAGYADKLASSDRWLIGSIFLTFVAFATIGTVLFMRTRILLVTTLFRESGKAIADMPLLLLQPLLTFAALAGIMLAWLAGLVCLQSMRVPVADPNTGFVVFRAETLYKIMKWYHIFAFLWVSHFAIACQHYVIGASVSKWYFTPNRYELSSPIGNSISELILYYLGSVALGSFLVAIFKVIRVITRQIQFLVQRSCMSPPLNANQALDGAGANSGPSGAPSSSSSSSCNSLGYVWRLFIWFFDNIVMIINRDAYVEIAIHGHSFLGGARRAFTVLASNPLRLLAIKSVGNVLLVIAKICVVVGTVSMAYVLLEGKSQQLNYAWSPIVITAIYAYIVAHWFLSVYEMVIDALFICYCEDYEQKNTQLNRQINGSNFRAQILSNGQIY